MKCRYWSDFWWKFSIWIEMCGKCKRHPGFCTVSMEKYKVCQQFVIMNLYWDDNIFWTFLLNKIYHYNLFYLFHFTFLMWAVWNLEVHVYIFIQLYQPRALPGMLLSSWMLNIRESIEENPSDGKLGACFHNITEGVEKNICFLIYQWRATKKKYSL